MWCSDEESLSESEFSLCVCCMREKERKSGSILISSYGYGYGAFFSKKKKISAFVNLIHLHVMWERKSGSK